MTAKNKEHVENLLLLSEAKMLRDGGFLSNHDVKAIRSKLHIPRTSENILIRIGFFLLGCFLYSSIMGAASIMFLDSIDAYKLILFVFAGIGLAAAEFLTRNGFHNYGLDDAFILGFQTVLFAAVGVATEQSTAVFTIMAIAGTGCCYRYFSTGSMLFALVGVAGFFASLITDVKLVSSIFLPFVMAAVAYGLYHLYRVIRQNPESRLYRNSVRLIKIFSLILGYLALNYLVVRELSEELMGLQVTRGNDIPLSYLFYFFTFAVPIFYIYVGARFNDRAFLVVGMLAMAFSIFSIRYYYSIVPIETALIFGGIILFGISWYSMSALRNREKGLTFKPDRFTDSDSLSMAQAIIINSAAQVKSDNHDQPMKFGGGGFSGGGAGDSY